jgi:hypothetical protein
VTSPAVITLGLNTTLNSVSVTCTTDEPDALCVEDPPFIATTATTPNTSAETATATIIMPSMDFANIESFALVLPLDSADIVTSVGTPKRYANSNEQQLLYEFCEIEINQQLRELFQDVTKSEH